MKKLIKDPEAYYSPAKRPSGHEIGSSFGKDNGGAIPSNLLQISNSEASSKYLKLCKEVGIKAHPARFPAKLPEFFQARDQRARKINAKIGWNQHTPNACRKKECQKL